MTDRLTDDGGFQIDEHSSRDVFAGAGFAEEGIKTVVAGSDSLVGWHLTVRLNAMFQTVEFPAGISDLNSGLANVDRDTFTLKKNRREKILGGLKSAKMEVCTKPGAIQ